MKPKFKRIIAREGLIIISILSMAGVSFYLNHLLMTQKSLYEANVQEIQPVYKDSKSGDRILDTQGIILRFPKNTNVDVIEQTMRRDFPNIKRDDWFIYDSPTGKNIRASYDDKGQRVFDNIIHKISFFDISAFFLIFAYPLYLLVRFVVWAIATLKERVDN